MKKFLITLFVFLTLNSIVYATTSEVFDNMDENALKAGISKYILTKGGKINHGDSYNSNIIQAVEQLKSGYSYATYRYVFVINPVEGGTKLDLTIYKSMSGSSPQNVDAITEQQVMDNIKIAIKGRFLYGLGFDFDYYDSPRGQIKAPKGRDTGIVITAVKYDALKKGLMAGDIIVAINGKSLKDIPLYEYATVLNARTMTDTLELTYKRNGILNNVILIPRLSNIKKF